MKPVSRLVVKLEPEINVIIVWPVFRETYCTMLFLEFLLRKHGSGSGSGSVLFLTTFISLSYAVGLFLS